MVISAVVGLQKKFHFDLDLYFFACFWFIEKKGLKKKKKKIISQLVL